MEDVVRRSMARASFIMVLLGVGSGALVLSAVGMYGVVSVHRVRSGARRSASAWHSARRRQIVRLVVMHRPGSRCSALHSGWRGAIATSRSLQSVLFEVSANDPVVLGGASSCTCRDLHGYVRHTGAKAARIDPTEAMRAD